MARVFGLFDSRAQAGDAAQRLLDAGVPLEALTVVAHDERRAEAAVGEAGVGEGDVTGQGAAQGGVLGLLAGIGLAAVPMLGPALMFGAPLTAAAGAALGAAAGTAAEPGLDPRVYAEGVRRGGTLVSAEVPDDRAEAVRDALLAAGAVDIGARAAEWRAAGWTPSADEGPYDSFGLNWAESSKLGTGGGAIAGAVTGAAVGAIGGPVGAALGAIAGAAAGAGVGAIGDAAGEAFAPTRAHEQQRAKDSDPT